MPLRIRTQNGQHAGMTEIAIPKVTLRSIPTRRTCRAFTLVEVMVSLVIFIFIAIALQGLFLQNLKLTRDQTYRTQAIATSSSIIEQIRFIRYPNLEPISVANGATPITVKISDPNYVPPSPATPDGYRPIDLNINVNNDVQIKDEWNKVYTLTDSATGAPRLLVEYWVTMKKVSVTSGKIHEAFEVVLLYRWRPEKHPLSAAKHGNVRVVIPRTTPNIT